MYCVFYLFLTLQSEEQVQSCDVCTAQIQLLKLEIICCMLYTHHAHTPPPSPQKSTVVFIKHFSNRLHNETHEVQT